MTTLNLEYIKKIISDRHYTEEKIPSFSHNLDFETFKELTIWVFCNKVGSSDDYMCSTYEFWKDLYYHEWLILFHYFISIHKQGGSAFGIVCFMDFFYKFLKVDFIHVYATTQMSDSQMKHWILDDFIYRPGKLYLDQREYKRLLQRYNLTFDNLFHAGDQLITQGAVKAEEIDPRNHTTFQGSVEIFFVQGPIPKSWTWIEKHNPIL